MKTARNIRRVNVNVLQYLMWTGRAIAMRLCVAVASQLLWLRTMLLPLSSSLTGYSIQLYFDAMQDIKHLTAEGAGMGWCHSQQRQMARISFAFTQPFTCMTARRSILLSRPAFSIVLEPNELKMQPLLENIPAIFSDPTELQPHIAYNFIFRHYNGPRSSTSQGNFYSRLHLWIKRLASITWSQAEELLVASWPRV